MATTVRLKAVEMPPPTNLPDATLAFGVGVFLMAVIVVCMAIRIPRLLALFGTSSEWIDGFLLSHVPARPFVRGVAQPPRSARCPVFIDDNRSDNSSIYDIMYKKSSQSKRHLLSKEKNRRPKSRYPPHVPSCIKPFRRLLNPLRMRIAPGFSSGQLLILLAYLGTLLYAVFHNSNVLLDQSRTGWIAVSQYPFIYAFAQKNNLIGAFLGLGYEKLNFFHRFAGKMVVLAANIHSFHFLYLWSFNGTLWDMIQIRNGQPIWGIIALFCLDFLYFFSTPYIREQAYNFFFRSHVISVMLLLPATYMHKHATLPYLFTCGVIYAFDCFFRVVKTRIATAYLRPLPEFGVTRVEIPYINAGWRAGQHVRLRVLTFQMGWLGWAETHPFTIASVSRHSPDGMVLLCKRAGDWTQTLYDMARMADKHSEDARIKVVVEGPYGGPGLTIYSSFSAAVLISGGSGITYSLAVLEDLIMKDLNNESRVKSINLVWTIPDPANLIPLLPTLTSLVRESVNTPVRISVFYTGAPSGNQHTIITETLRANQKNSPATLTTNLKSGTRPSPANGLSSSSGGVTLNAGRPNFRKILNEATQAAVSLSYGVKDDEPITGVVVGVCGPIKMADDVSEAVSSIDPIRRDQVGGIEICEEVFGW